MKKAILTIFAAALLLLSGCSRIQKETLSYYTYFDTITQITFYHSGDEETAKAIQNAAEDTLKSYHEAFDIYNTYENGENLASLNEAPTSPHSLDPMVKEVLDFCLENYENVKGKTNVFAGALLSLWHDAREDGGYIPSQSQIDEALKHTDPGCFDLESMSFSDDKMSVDCGAVTKGAAADALAQSMKQAGAEAGVIDLGGNVLCFGSLKDKEYFTVGIQNPDGNGLAATAKVKDMSLVTSGDYQRTYTVDGKTYHHIIDPDTGYPGGEFSSVTVMHQSSLTADFLSTALFLMDEETGRKTAELYGAEVMWIKSDGTLTYTDGFPIIK